MSNPANVQQANEQQTNEQMSGQMRKWASKWADNEQTSWQMSEQAGKWADKRANDWVSGKKRKQAGKWANEWSNKRANEQANGQMSKLAGKWGQDRDFNTRFASLKRESCFCSKVFHLRYGGINVGWKKIQRIIGHFLVNNEDTNHWQQWQRRFLTTPLLNDNDPAAAPLLDIY